MWVSPQWQRSVDKQLLWNKDRKSQFSCFTLGFIYKHGHASDLKTITTLKGQVRKRIKMRSFCRQRCWNALLHLDIVQSTKWWADGHLRTIKNVYYSQQEQSVWTPLRLKKFSVLRFRDGERNPPRKALVHCFTCTTDLIHTDSHLEQ